MTPEKKTAHRNMAELVYRLGRHVNSQTVRPEVKTDMITEGYYQFQLNNILFAPPHIHCKMLLQWRSLKFSVHLLYLL